MKFNSLYKQVSRIMSAALVLTLTLSVLTPTFAAPSQPENVTVSGDETKPTVSWDSVEAEANGVDWTEATDKAGWGARVDHTTEVFNNKLWVTGGLGNGTYFNDVWHTEDGKNWVEATDNAAWDARRGHESVVFDNKLWVMGGHTGTTDCNGSGTSRCQDVWFSEDGVNWTEATASAAWDARRSHTSVVFDNKLWVMGGLDSAGNRHDDVWSSEDGVNWTEVTSGASWSGRHEHDSVVFDNKLWVMGGKDANGDNLNDVWFSEDGVNWTEATASAAWNARRRHSSVVFDNNIWMLGGGGDSGRYSDVWRSADGVTWEEVTGDASWSERELHTSGVFNDQLWILGGQSPGVHNSDVWSTPNNSISHYRVCWDKTEGECSNSAKVDPDGNVVSLNSSSPSWLTRIKETILPTVNAQSDELSYTLEDELDSGTWYFSVTAVTMAGDESTSPGTATHDVSDSTAGLPDTGYGPQDSGYMNYMLLTLIGAGVLGSSYYLVRRKLKAQG